MSDSVFAYVPPERIPTGSGDLDGKRYSIQPNMSVSGWPTDAGSLALENYRPLETAAVVERVESAGGRIVGSTHMAELGLGIHGDSARDAVSEGLCDVAFVTDTLGESRWIASKAGAFGLKPSYGRVSRFGLIGLVPSMEAYGLVSKKIEDLIKTMARLSAKDPREPSMCSEDLLDLGATMKQPLGVSTIGVIQECRDGLNAEACEAFDKDLSKLERTGVSLRRISFPELALFQTVHHVVGAVEASSSAGKLDGVRYGHRASGTENWNEMYMKSRAEAFGSLVKSYLFQGAYFQFEDYEAFESACRVRRRLVEAMDSLFDQVDLLAYPCHAPGGPSLEKPPSVKELYDTFGYTLPWNVTGQPALVLDGDGSGTKREVGIQLVARFMDDARLLAFADQLTRGT